jgi:hypothetical protein
MANNDNDNLLSRILATVFVYAPRLGVDCMDTLFLHFEPNKLASLRVVRLRIRRMEVDRPLSPTVGGLPDASDMRTEHRSRLRAVPRAPAWHRNDRAQGPL